jgi:hypothetical protein
VSQAPDVVNLSVPHRAGVRWLLSDRTPGALPCLSIVRLSTRVDGALRDWCSTTGYDYFKNSYVTRGSSVELSPSVGIGTLDQ